jgi:8-oxo-dGTP diphosphatase
MPKRRLTTAMIPLAQRTATQDNQASSTPSATVCFVCRDDKVLLQERAAGRIWAGRLNGPGGKIDAGESPETAIVREVAEETGLRLVDPVPHGVLDLIFGDPEQRLRVFIFSCATFNGRARGGHEGRLRWYAARKLPFDRLWPDMRYWLPAVLDGGSVTGQCVFDATGERLLSCSLRLELRV